jgi:plasmid replication initiation protein
MIKYNFKDETIVKANSLIEARMQFTANEYKLINYLLGKIKMNDRYFRTFDISIQELNKYCFGGISGTKTYNYIKNDYSQAFASKNITIKGENGVSIYNWFTLIDTNKHGIFSICFSPELQDFLLEENANYDKGSYTKYKLSNILNLKSFYTIRIYELLKQYEKLGKRVFKLEGIRYILGIEKNQYKRYDNFRRRILLPSIELINSYTDLKVSFEENKLGRNVNEITFYVVSQRTIYKSTELLEIKEKIENVLKNEVKINILENTIKKNNLKKEDIYYYLENWEKFDYKKLNNPVGFLFKCVEDKISLPIHRQGMGNKPEQATNFEQREYDDEFFESLYENF